MKRYIRVWWKMITGIGSAMRLGRQADRIFRYYVLKVLADEGLFEYLQEPRTYGQILSQFNFVDTDYTRELFEILVADKNSLLIKNGNTFRHNTDQPFSDIDKIIDSTDKRIRDFTFMAKGMTQYILPRLRNERIEFSDTFEQDGRQLLTKFDRALGSKIYTALRNASFAFLTNEEQNWLRGKTLIDVGCGSGREAAELWVKLDGQLAITGIDPVASMLEIARENFEEMIRQLAPQHLPMLEANFPVFQEASATRLPFEDNTFDAAFHSLMMHWTPDPRRAISEVVRVVKPGGLIFGTQGTKPYLDPYFDLVIRTNENSYGFFWREEFLRWYREQGVELEIVTPAGVFRGHKPA